MEWKNDAWCRYKKLRILDHTIFYCFYRYLCSHWSTGTIRAFRKARSEKDYKDSWFRMIRGVYTVYFKFWFQRMLCDQPLDFFWKLSNSDLTVYRLKYMARDRWRTPSDSPVSTVSSTGPLTTLDDKFDTSPDSPVTTVSSSGPLASRDVACQWTSWINLHLHEQIRSHRIIEVIQTLFCFAWLSKGAFVCLLATAITSSKSGLQRGGHLKGFMCVWVRVNVVPHIC